MHIPKKEVEVHSSIDYSINFLQKKHPDYKIYNSCDVRSLDFLSRHIDRLKDKEQKHYLSAHQLYLEKIYLVTLKHKRYVEDPSLLSLFFIVDLNKNYIKRIQDEVVLVEDKLLLLADYFKKSYLQRLNLQENTPKDLHASLKNGIVLLKNLYPNHTITDILSFDKRDEQTGYFILFRLKSNHDQAMRHFVYELCHNTRFDWDSKCANFSEYYGQYKEYFKDVACGTKL